MNRDLPLRISRDGATCLPMSRSKGSAVNLQRFLLRFIDAAAEGLAVADDGSAALLVGEIAHHCRRLRRALRAGERPSLVGDALISRRSQPIAGPLSQTAAARSACVGRWAAGSRIQASASPIGPARPRSRSSRW